MREIMGVGGEPASIRAARAVLELLPGAEKA
jgi:lipid-A-disaccharide synthase